MNTSTKSTIIRVATLLGTYIPVNYAVTKTLNDVDDIHQESTGEKTSGLKTVSNGFVGVTAGWGASLIAMIVIESVIEAFKK